MDKTHQPRGLIRYASYKELHHNADITSWYTRPRVIIYGLILLVALSGIVYGFGTLSATEFKVVHERSPLFVRLSDGSIQNKYTLKLLNKTKESLQIKYSVTGLDGATLHGLNSVLTIEPGKVIPVTALVRVPADKLNKKIVPIQFKGEVESNPKLSIEYKSMFMGPK